MEKKESMWGADGPIGGMILLMIFTLMFGGAVLFDCAESGWVRFGAYMFVIWLAYGIGYHGGREARAKTRP